MTARRTLAIAAAALLCGVGDVLLVLGSEHLPDPGVWAVFGPVVGWSFVGTGLYAWWRRPESRFGLLMTLAGFAWFLGPLRPFVRETLLSDRSLSRGYYRPEVLRRVVEDQPLEPVA